jgi:hypothetical protein
MFEFIVRLVGLFPVKSLKLIWYYSLYSRCTLGKLRKVFMCFSCEKVFARFKKVVVCCSSCGECVGFVGVFRFGGGGLVYEVWKGGEGDDDCW